VCIIIYVTIEKETATNSLSAYPRCFVHGDESIAMVANRSVFGRWHGIGAAVGLLLLALAVVGVPQVLGPHLSPLVVRTIQYGLYLTVFSIWMAWFVSVSVSVWRWVDANEEEQC
jgi:hypothetical protein